MSTVVYFVGCGMPDTGCQDAGCRIQNPKDLDCARSFTYAPRLRSGFDPNTSGRAFGAP